MIQFGNGGFVVSLPRSWVAKNNLKKGDMLTIREEADQLTFSMDHTDQKKEETRITIEVTGKKISRIKSEIVSAYLNNYHVIELIAKNKMENPLEIKHLLRDLAGMEIMEQTSTKLVAKDLINIQDISIDNIIRQIDNIIRGMTEDCVKCIKGDDHYESIFQRDLDVNRLFYLCIRVIKGGLKNLGFAKILKRENSELALDWLVLVRLEKIADRQKRIARALLNVKLSDSSADDLERLYLGIREAYCGVMKAYYTFDKDAAYDIEIANAVTINNCTEFLRKNTGCMLVNSKQGAVKKSPKIEKSNCVHIARIVENMNAMSTSIKYIARRVMDRW
ncbi:MAG: hypothetical protein ABIC04_00240 [Nanoarchaeota archaeon]